MPVQLDFPLQKYDDAVLVISLAPPVVISGKSIQFQVIKRFDGTSGLITKSMASGFNAVSGMACIDGSQGIMSITIMPSDTSGLDWGCYSYRNRILESGANTTTTEGYMILNP